MCVQVPGAVQSVVFVLLLVVIVLTVVVLIFISVVVCAGSRRCTGFVCCSAVSDVGLGSTGAWASPASGTAGGSSRLPSVP